MRFHQGKYEDPVVTSEMTFRQRATATCNTENQRATASTSGENVNVSRRQKANGVEQGAGRQRSSEIGGTHQIPGRPSDVRSPHYFFKPPSPSAAAASPPRRAVGAFGPSSKDLNLEVGLGPLEFDCWYPPRAARERRNGGRDASRRVSKCSQAGRGRPASSIMESSGTPGAGALRRQATSGMMRAWSTRKMGPLYPF